MTPTGDNPFNQIKFDVPEFPNGDPTDAGKLMKIEQWGDIAWSSMENAYTFATNLKITATDIPDLSNDTNMKQAFAYSDIDSISNINSWDVSHVTNM